MRPDRPHQARVIAWAKPRSTAAFFLDMRLGKTHVAIRWAHFRAPRGLKLVVAPITTLISWCEELEADGMQYVMLHGSSKQKLAKLDSRKSDQKWILVNPEGLRACPALLAGLQLEVVILDESTFISNPAAKITKMMLLKLGDVKNRAILSGDPDPEGTLHAYYCQMKFLAGYWWMNCMSFWHWRTRYFHKSGYDWKPHTTTEFLIQRAVKEDAYVLSSDKIFGHKPVRVRRHVDMSPKLMKLYKNAWKKFELGDAQTKWTPVVQTWLAQMAGGSIPKDYDARGKKFFDDFKMKELRRLLDTELAHKQVVVFFRFTREIMRAEKLLQDCAVVHGKTTIPTRKRNIENFRKGKVRVLLMQAKCARYALPLWMASAAIFYSNYWDCGTRKQLEARLHGENRTDQPLYIDLVAKNTVDEKVVNVLGEKKYSSSEFLRRVREIRL